MKNVESTSYSIENSYAQGSEDSWSLVSSRVSAIGVPRNNLWSRSAALKLSTTHIDVANTYTNEICCDTDIGKQKRQQNEI
jgi:diketogulonate reductase-like aldo/keto reductase